MSRRLKYTLGILLVLVAVGAIMLPSLRRSVRDLSKNARSEEQARREVMQPKISTPTDTKVTPQMFWLSETSSADLAPVQIELTLSADPVLRSKQLLNALIDDAPAPERRTLPADTTLLAFYLQPDGTAIADFSDAISTQTPAGILSEQLAVDSIIRTLAASVPSIRQLKILIHGQDSDTLAGHLDLEMPFPLPTTALQAAPAAQPASQLQPQPPAKQAH